jgi:outer membrane assembly lipoprotein YfiO
MLRSSLALAVTIAALTASTHAQTPGEPTTPPESRTSGRWVLQADGTWIRVTPADEQRFSAEPDARLDAIEALVKAGRWKPARRELVTWFRANPDSPVRDRALLLMADALIGFGDGIRAFYFCDELMDTYPTSPLFIDALQTQYDIADQYLLGRRDRFLGFSILGRTDEALDMLFRIQQRAPASPISERALLRTADFYWADAQWDLAADAYGTFARSFPRTPFIEEVRLREAYSNLAQYNGPLYDPTPVLNARAQLLAIADDFADASDRENIPDRIEFIDRQTARRLYLTADFYRRTGKPDAAVHVARQLVEKFPELPEAQDALDLIVRLDPQGGAQ